MTALRSGHHEQAPIGNLWATCASMRSRHETELLSHRGKAPQRRLGIKRINPYVSATCTQRPINQESKFDLSLDRKI
jgi:hypothetical protein